MADHRKVVVHHTHLLPGLMQLLEPSDMLFFDDCLFSQWQFIMSNVQQLQSLGIECVLGLSTRLVRTSQKPFCEVSAKLHSRVHSGDMSALGGFMSISEIRQLLSFSNVRLAGHGAHHLDLRALSGSKLEQAKLFNADVKLMAQDLQ